MSKTHSDKQFNKLLSWTPLTFNGCAQQKRDRQVAQEHGSGLEPGLSPVWRAE